MKTTLDTPTDILIFETSLRCKQDVLRVSPMIAANTRIKKWNVDCEDVSKVLRVEAHDMSPHEIIEIITKAGYHCAELQD